MFIYPTYLSPEVTAYNYLHPADLPTLEVTTPFAICVPTFSGPKSDYQHNKGRVPGLLKAGWRLLAWDWSSHGTREDPKNYMIAYLGKAFDLPVNPAYKLCKHFSTGCSDRSCYSWETLKTCKQQKDPYNYGGSGWLRLYYGPKLTPEQKAEAKGLGWRGVRGTNLMVLGKTAKELPADVKEELGL